jgi:hypothetical protein
MHTVIATYRNIAEAQKAVTDLVNAGFDRDNISLVASDAEGRYQHLTSRTDVDDHDVSAGEGALVGGLEGGIIGVALGLGALAIPGIGPVLAFGPLIGGLIGAGAGAVTGGLVASLIDLGIDETDAHTYAEAVRRGYTLVTVHAAEGRVNEARSILSRYDVVDIDDRAEHWRSQGWTSHEVNAKPFARKDIEAEHGYWDTGYNRDFDSNLEDFRKHYRTNYANNQYSFNNYQPAYQYGYGLADDPRYTGRTWMEIEPEVRRDWESRGHGAWEDFKDSVRYAWERAKAAVR